MVNALPETDRAYPIVAAILRVVPVSRWAFARLESGGELGHLLASESDGSELGELKSELTRQRAKARTGSRIAATLGPLGDDQSGVSLLFADAKATFGVLTLLRTSELGAFSSTEISILTLALDATSELLSALRLNPRNAETHREARPAMRDDQQAHVVGSDGAYYVLDSDLQIVLTWSADEQRRAAVSGLHTRLGIRLPSILEETVRALIAGWHGDPVTYLPGIARPVPFLVVRTQPLLGSAGLFVGVRIDRFQPQHSLAGPAARFHISPRELEVLALLLDGAKLDEIGQTLCITSSTVQDHIKSMVEKTDSRNRTGLIAHVLGWG